MIGSVLRTEHVEGSSTLLKYQFQSNENVRNTNLAMAKKQIAQFNVGRIANPTAGKWTD